MSGQPQVYMEPVRLTYQHLSSTTCRCCCLQTFLGLGKD